MVPLEEGAYFSQNGSNIGLGRSENIYEGSSVYADEQKNQSYVAQQEFTDYLEKMKATLTQEEFRKLLIRVYQGCNLRYQRNCHVEK